MTTGFSKMRRAKVFFERLVHCFANDEKGATSIEYGLIVSLIFLAILAAVNGYVDSTSEMYSEIASAMSK